MPFWKVETGQPRLTDSPTALSRADQVSLRSLSDSL